ncbi:MAG: SufB/SufD family protein [Lachnospiraceae bacterium]|jgi:Fe-S cluster assembly scaffold protein SufB
MDTVEQRILEEVAGIHEVPTGAFNIRSNGESVARQSSANVEIIPKENGTGIEVHIKPGTVNESVHIPVILSLAGIKEVVYNDFYIGEDSDVVIVAGCGIHNCGNQDSQHDGIHTFHIGKNAKVKYIEKHYGEGDGEGGRILNPVTNVYIEEGGSMEMDTVQIKGVTSTKRDTKAVLDKDASITVKEKLMTHGKQFAQTEFTVDMNGEGSSANIISRSVAKGESKQIFLSKINGNAPCAGHSECDAIIMDSASVGAIPEITANHLEASLIHEAAIGKIAGEQLTKLMTLGLTEQEAEEQIVNGFLK